MMASNIKRIDIDMKELETILDRARDGTLDEEGYKKLKAALETLGYLTNLIGDKNMTIRRLRNIVFGPSTGKSKSVLEKLPAAAGSTKAKEAEDAATAAKDHEPRDSKKPKGHGRNGASAYTGAKKIRIAHESLKPGDVCPDCGKGKVYHGKVPAYIVRLVGSAPISAIVWELENLRDVLAQRAAELREPIQMCDGLSRNLPKEFEVILSGCNFHARRNFVEVADQFPDWCRHSCNQRRTFWPPSACGVNQPRYRCGRTSRSGKIRRFLPIAGLPKAHDFCCLITQRFFLNSNATIRPTLPLPS
jgi:hypothetical protein